MTGRGLRRTRRNKSLQEVAFQEKKKHDNLLKGKRTILVPHPTVPKTLIEKVIE